MYIIIELDELEDLVAAVKAKQDPDVPLDKYPSSSFRLLERVAHLLDSMNDADFQDEDDTLRDLVEDETIVDLASQILEFVSSRLMLRDRIQWFSVIDHRGGLAIRIRPEKGNAAIHF